MTESFRQTCINRAFELAVLELIRQGRVVCPTYISLGSEHVPPAVLEGLGGERWPLFVQHRCHSWCLTWGMKPHAILSQLTAGPMGSASLGDPACGVHGHDGLLGSQVPIAVGFAAGSGRKTVCVLGDGACEEDYVLGALGHAATVEAPVLFVVEDNELSVETQKPKRRSWSMVRVAKGFGMIAKRVEGSPEEITEAVDFCRVVLPALIEVPVVRGCAHNSLRDQGSKDSFYFDRMKGRMGPDGEKVWQGAQAAMADAASTHISGDHCL